MTTSESYTSNFPFFCILLSFNNSLINVVEFVDCIVQEYKPFLINDMKDPILQPVGQPSYFSHSFALNKVQILSKQHHNRTIVNSLHKNLKHLDIVKVIVKIRISQLIVNWQHFGIIAFMNSLFKLTICKKHFKYFEKLLVHLSLVKLFCSFEIYLFKLSLLISRVLDDRLKLGDY